MECIKLKFKWVIFPIEIKVRDYLPRLSIISFLIQKGYGIIFGRQSSIVNIIDYLPKGLFFDKSLSINKIEFYRKIKSLGFKITSIDEEGLCYKNDKNEYFNYRITSQALDLAEFIFTWGDEEKEMILEKFPVYSKKIISTGNPRLDIIKRNFLPLYKKEIKIYNDQYNDFLFFPSNFTANHILGKDGKVKLFHSIGRLGDLNGKDIYDSRQKYLNQTMKRFMNLIELVSKEFEKQNIVIRPHPAEDRAMWDTFAKGKKNVFIEYRGAVNSWLLASKVVIHSSCTTGIEAAVMKKPVISFLPYQHEYNKHFSNKLSYVVKDEKTCIDILRKIIFEGSSISLNQKLKKDEINYILKNFDEENSFNSIVEQIENLSFLESTFNVSSKTNESFRDKIYQLKSKFFNQNLYKYNKNKFGNFSKDQLNKDMHKINEIFSFKTKHNTLKIKNDVCAIFPNN